MRYRFFQSKFSGFTLLEVLLTVSVAAILAAIGGVAYFNAYRTAALKNSAEEIVTELRFAQQRAISQEQANAWGVKIDNTASNSPYLEVFTGAYAPANVVYHYSLPGTVGMQSPASGTSTEITFAKLTGIPSAATTIVLTNRGSGQTKTITINEFGGIGTD